MLRPLPSLPAMLPLLVMSQVQTLGVVSKCMRQAMKFILLGGAVAIATCPAHRWRRRMLQVSQLG